MRSTKIISIIIRGIPSTLTLLILSFIFATILGILLTWLHLRHSRIATGIVNVYLGIIRGTPPLLMLLLAYYGLPPLLKLIGININGWAKIAFGILGLSIGWSGYLSETFRSAYLAVDRGQIEAAQSIGMNHSQIFWQFLLPQTALIALPNIENLVIGLTKATSLVYVIGVYDMYNEASNLSNQSSGIHQLQIFIILAFMYWVIVLIIEWGFRMIRHHYRFQM